MIIKNTDDKTEALQTLELLAQYPNLTTHQQKAIEKEINLMRAGMKGEQEAVYQIDFAFKDSDRALVIHDLRLEINGRVAQIDHLLIGRSLITFVLETKYFNAGLKINDHGELLKWNNYLKTYEGMASPIEQNERHIAVLKDAFDLIDIPKRLGMRLAPTFHSFVVVSSNTRVDRSEKFDSSSVIKADTIKTILRQKIDKMGVIDTISNAARLVSYETLEHIARQLCALHRPIAIDYKAKFGIIEPVPASINNVTHHCRHCDSSNLSIQYAKNYYFKCLDCDGNTSIKVACDKENCKARIRKEGNYFHRECAICNSSTLYFTNP